MNRSAIPEFAVVGHPNEGKSSVLSTLAEDDSVRISPVPGETRQCQRFPVLVDDREVLAFIDTPGFQNPRRTLRWLTDYAGPEEKMLTAFLAAHRDDPAFRDDCRLLAPLLTGAGIIFVVDGSRPLRGVDRAEMEILRLTGLPRLAILNCKQDQEEYLDQWRAEFRKHFNAIRLFNSMRATFGQRISLLESLKVIDQDLEPVLAQVVLALKKDWRGREEESADAILALLEEVLTRVMTATIREGEDPARVRARLENTFNDFVRDREKQCRRRIRRLFKHNIFALEPDPHSLVSQDLFARETWRFLGLTDRQLVTAAALGGAAVGAGIALAHAGLTFGVFSALGGALGAAATALRGRHLLSGLRLAGVRLDRRELVLGPVNNPQLMYILLDRALLHYRWVINWTHARREISDADEQRYRRETGEGVASWPARERAV